MTRRIILALLILMALLPAVPTSAQLIVVDQELYVTELRPDKMKIGTSAAKISETRGWVKLEGDTKIFRRNGKPVSQAFMWKNLKRGMKIKVHGGGDWDTNVVARKIWF